MSTFAYDQAARKHATGQKLSEPEWEALLAGERAARAQAENDRDLAREEAEAAGA
jgi:hypothetical protein